MINKSRFVESFLLFLALFIFMAPKAHAYIDPTTGSYAIEMITGALFTFFFAAKAAWRTLKARLHP